MRKGNHEEISLSSLLELNQLTVPLMCWLLILSIILTSKENLKVFGCKGEFICWDFCKGNTHKPLKKCESELCGASHRCGWRTGQSWWSPLRTPGPGKKKTHTGWSLHILSCLSWNSELVQNWTFIKTLFDKTSINPAGLWKQIKPSLAVDAQDSLLTEPRNRSFIHDFI